MATLAELQAEKARRSNTPTLEQLQVEKQRRSGQPDYAAAFTQDPLEQQRKRAEEMGVPRAFIEGMGRAGATTAQGIKQLYLEELGSPEEAEAYRQEIASEKERYEAGVGATPSGMIGEFAGEVLQTVPAAAIPVAGPAAAAGKLGKAANLAKRFGTMAGVGAAEAGMKPVFTEGDFEAQKKTQAGIGAAFAAVIPAGGAIINRYLPKNIKQRLIKKYGETEYIEKLSEIDLNEDGTISGIMIQGITPGQFTQDPYQLQLEEVARKYVLTSGDVLAHERKTLENAAEATLKVIGLVGKPSNLLEAGHKIQNATSAAVDSLFAVRKQNGDRLYQIANDMAGDSPVIPSDNVRATLQKIIKDNENSVADDSVNAVSKARSMLKKLTQEEEIDVSAIVDVAGKPLREDITPAGGIMRTLKEARDDQSFYSKASQGKRQILKDTSRDMNRDFAIQMRGAIEKDLDAAQGPGQLGRAIREANDQWKADSLEIAKLEGSVVGKLLGKEFKSADESASAVADFYAMSPDKVFDIVKKADSSTLKTAFQILGRNNPKLSRNWAASLMNDAFVKAGDKSKMSDPTAIMSTDVFRKEMAKIKPEKWDALGVSKEHQKTIDQLLDEMARITDVSKAAKAGRSDIMQVQRLTGQAVSGGMVDKVLRFLPTLGAKKTAALMTDPQALKALKDLLNPTATQKQATDNWKKFVNASSLLLSQQVGASIGESEQY